MKRLSMFTIFRKEKSQSQEDRFNNVMSRAIELQALNRVEGLRDLIKIIMLPLQAKHISDAYFQKDHGGMESIRIFIDLGIERYPSALDHSYLSSGLFSGCMIDEKKNEKLVSLASDILLPTSWHPSSIVDMLGTIGSDAQYKLGAFKKDINHIILYSYPLNITWVHNGNHSIIQGILRGEGHLEANEIIDLSPIIELIAFNGVNWLDISNGRVLGKPRYQEFGIAWEIGRLIANLEDNPFQQTD